MLDEDPIKREYVGLQQRIGDILKPNYREAETEEVQEQIQALLSKVLTANTEINESINEIFLRKDTTENQCLKKEERFSDISSAFEIFQNSEFNKVKHILESEINTFKASNSEYDKKINSSLFSSFTQELDLQDIEQGIAKFQEANEGLHIIDFEQLKLDNNTLRQKIETRSLECNKAKVSVQEYIHEIAHLRQKLLYMQRQNGDLEEQSKLLSDELKAVKEDLQSRVKERDHESKQLRTLSAKYRLLKTPKLLNNMKNIAEEEKKLSATNENLKEKFKLLQQTDSLMA